MITVCPYDEVDPPARTSLLLTWCHKCGWAPPNELMGTYVKDVVISGQLFHEIELDKPIVCGDCGHSATVIRAICNSGNQRASIEKYRERPRSKKIVHV
jgi:hypothetical protein